MGPIGEPSRDDQCAATRPRSRSARAFAREGASVVCVDIIDAGETESSLRVVEGARSFWTSRGPMTSTMR